METTIKLVKVYSNNSKKARLKRNKNKFQRIWDAEKQTYIKVRKAKYPVKPTTKKKDWREINDEAALKRRRETTKKPKSVPVNVQQKVKKSETKKALKQPARVEKKAVTFNMFGVKHVWDSQKMCYKRAA